MTTGWIVLLLLLLPATLAGASFLVRTAVSAIRLCAIGTLATCALAFTAALRMFQVGPLVCASGWFRIDALSAYHLMVIAMVFSLSALSALAYFREELASGSLTLQQAKRYVALWFGALTSMMLVLISDNLGVLWVGIEATTLLTAFLICVHPSRGALEAMWKYLLICSVGVALAFTGILLVTASAGPAGLHGADAMLWTRLRAVASQLDPRLLKAGFIFLFIGYGTKAGLAPMHNWLPDAHSQAPSPVSAVFSGILLNLALYCILRYLPLVDALPGCAGWGHNIFVVFGLISIFVAAVFLMGQHDIKRLLAYSSVEHIGIITLGIGLGGAGAVAAFLHLLSHSLAKTVGFLCAGRIGQAYGTHDVRRMSGLGSVSRLWSVGLLVSLLILIGVAPGAIFISEFLVLKAALETHAYATAILFLVGVGVVFIAVLRRLIPLLWGEPPEAPVHSIRRPGPVDIAIVVLPLFALIGLGLWIPDRLLTLIRSVAQITGGAL